MASTRRPAAVRNRISASPKHRRSGIRCGPGPKAAGRRDRQGGARHAPHVAVRAECDDFRLSRTVGQASARDDARVGAPPNVMTSAPDPLAGPSALVKSGEQAASRASRSAASAVGGEQSGAVWNGPLSGVARSSAGSAIAVAAARSIQGARRISTGADGIASRWLVSFNVAARLPEISKAAGASAPSNAARPSASAVSTASREMSSTAAGQPRRRASIARATSRAPIRARIP